MTMRVRVSVMTQSCQNIEKIILKTWRNQVRQRKPIPFSWRLEKKWCRNGVWRVFRSVLVEKEMGKIVNNHKKIEGKTEKVLKTVFKMQNTRFSRLKQVASKSPGQAAKTLKDKIVKKFSKCFLWLEDLPARESRAEPRKSLCTPRDWTFHSRTSRQNQHASLRLQHMTWMTYDWVTKTG